MTTSALSSMSMVSYALAYAKQGWAVHPLQSRGKKPLTEHGVKEASTDENIVCAWWRRWPAANIGVAVPRGYVVLDVDSDEALFRLKAEDRELPATARGRTAKGFHYWYRTKQSVQNRVGLLPGIDVRAPGGYVVVPPSIHPTGAAYKWLVLLKRDAIAPAPEWLLQLLSETRPPGGRMAESWEDAIAQPVPPGRRNQALTELAGLLFRRLPAGVANELAFCWARIKLVPPLPDAEVRRTIDSIAGRELRRRGGSR
ncbi:MAG: DNA primase [Thermoanaerobaculia bacterium]|nr:DNA primase [Thermoanaerobaculia bacterium]